MVKAAAKGESGWLFAVPVTDDVAPGYSQEITNPMDLGTVTRNLKSGAYYTLGTPIVSVSETWQPPSTASPLRASYPLTGAWEPCSCMGQDGVVSLATQ